MWWLPNHVKRLDYTPGLHKQELSVKIHILEQLFSSSPFGSAGVTHLAPRAQWWFFCLPEAAVAQARDWMSTSTTAGESPAYGCVRADWPDLHSERSNMRKEPHSHFLRSHSSCWRSASSVPVLCSHWPDPVNISQISKSINFQLFSTLFEGFVVNATLTCEGCSPAWSIRQLCFWHPVKSGLKRASSFISSTVAIASQRPGEGNRDFSFMGPRTAVQCQKQQNNRLKSKKNYLIEILLPHNINVTIVPYVVGWWSNVLHDIKQLWDHK